MNPSILVFLALVALIRAAPPTSNIKIQWKSFKLQHHKQYNSEMEEHIRMNVFEENHQKILRHNELYANGKVFYKLKLNQFADLMQHEYKSMMNGFNHTAHKAAMHKGSMGSTFMPPANVTLMKEMDWRSKGGVTPVKNQGQCGSCWSFSATGALEGQYFRKSGNLVSLSEQNLVDCTTSYGNKGCTGGWPSSAFQYIADNGGIDTEDSYPYEAVNDNCRYNANSVGATDSGFVSIPPGDEESLKQAVATTGPVSIAIDASLQSFQFYSGGVYYDPSCSSGYLDHAVLAVGYGTDSASGLDYWLVKNSWGTTWGDGGYIKIARNQGNHCGVATAASFPTV
uniref:cathepsin L n=1 Tax=Stomoxys calcitrans TaxID=35570 RepID=A0A1I8PDI4_STOCA